MGEALNTIIKACFEGFFGTMVAGWTFYTIQSIRKNRRMLIWLWLILAGMAIWRFFIPNFYSPRYAAIFFFPAILLTAYMMVIFKKWWWVLLVVLGVICCCKILRTNATGRLLTDAADLIRKDAAGRKFPLVVIDKKDDLRMEFYSSISTLPFLESKDFTKKLQDLSRIISNNSKQADVVYLCCDVPHGIQITGKDLNLNGEWTLLHSAISNRRKKINFHVYRYCKNKEEFSPAIPEGKNLLINGNFENSIPIQKPVLQRLIRRKHSFFTADTQIPVPWGIDISIPGLNVAIEASENHPINGRKSLRLKTPAHYCRVVSNSFIMQDTAKFYFRIRGKEKSLGELTLLCYKQLRNYRPVAISLLPVRILQDNQIMECAFTFNPAEYGVKGQYFRLILSINAGEIFFDDVMVINTTAGK